jgi:hypothetical protein
VLDGDLHCYGGEQRGIGVGEFAHQPIPYVLDDASAPRLDNASKHAKAGSHAAVRGGITELLIEARAVADVDEQYDGVASNP